MKKTLLCLDMLDYLLVRLAVDADATMNTIPPTCFGFVVLGSGFGGILLCDDFVPRVLAEAEGGFGVV